MRLYNLLGIRSSEFIILSIFVAVLLSCSLFDGSTSWHTDEMITGLTIEEMQDKDSAFVVARINGHYALIASYSDAINMEYDPEKKKLLKFKSLDSIDIPLNLLTIETIYIDKKFVGFNEFKRNLLLEIIPEGRFLIWNIREGKVVPECRYINNGGTSSDPVRYNYSKIVFINGYKFYSEESHSFP